MPCNFLFCSPYRRGMRKNGVYITVILMMILAIAVRGTKNRKLAANEVGRSEQNAAEQPGSGFFSPWSQLTEGILHFS